MKNIIQLFSFAFPWGIRKRILSAIGFNLGDNSKIGFSILNVKLVELGENARIGHLNFFRGLEHLSLSASASIGNLNWVTGNVYQETSSLTSKTDSSASLILQQGAAISNRHYIDCNATITFGKFSTFAGVRSQIFTHSIDLKNNLQRILPIVIGDYTFIGTGCIILPGAVFPNNSVLSAGSVLRKGLSSNSKEGLYSGNPASFEKEIAEGALYFSRSEPVVKTRS